MQRHYLALLSSICCWATLFAQPSPPPQALQQQLLCDPAIVWASTMDVDLVPERLPDQPWSAYRNSGLSSRNFTQRDTTLQVGDTTLTAYWLQAIMRGEIDLYQTDSLQRVIPLEEVDIRNWWEGDAVEERYPLIEAVEIEVLRLRCYVYYNQREARFYCRPLAAGLIRTEYDGPSSPAFYHLIGWMPVETGSAQALAWKKRIHRDVDLREAFVFKQIQPLEWCMQQLIDGAFEQQLPYPSYAPDALNEPVLLSKNALKEAVSESYEEYDPDTFEPYEVIDKLLAERLIGMTISIDLGWNTAPQLLARPMGYAPIVSNMDLLCEGKDCFKERMYLKRVFYTKLEE